MINKSDSCYAVVRFCHHSYDYTQNWTPLSPITITNHNGNTSNNYDVTSNNDDSNNRDSIKDISWQLSFELSRSIFELSALKGYKLFKFFLHEFEVMKAIELIHE